MSEAGERQVRDVQTKSTARGDQKALKSSRFWCWVPAAARTRAASIPGCGGQFCCLCPERCGSDVSEEQMQNCQSKCPAKETDLDSIRRDYPYLDYSKCDDLQAILNGKVVVRKACPAWFEEQNLVVYNANIENLRKNRVCRVAYWLQSEECDDATDYDMPMYQLATDLLHKDLVYC